MTKLLDFLVDLTVYLFHRRTQWSYAFDMARGPIGFSAEPGGNILITDGYTWLLTGRTCGVVEHFLLSWIAWICMKFSNWTTRTCFAVEDDVRSVVAIADDANAVAVMKHFSLSWMPFPTLSSNDCLPLNLRLHCAIAKVDFRLHCTILVGVGKGVCEDTNLWRGIRATAWKLHAASAQSLSSSTRGNHTHMIKVVNSASFSQWQGYCLLLSFCFDIFIVASYSTIKLSW